MDSLASPSIRQFWDREGTLREMSGTIAGEAWREEGKPVTDTAQTTYAYLRQRARQVLLERGGIASEEQLVVALFGSLGNPRLWSPFLTELLKDEADLVRHLDGTWMLRERPWSLQEEWPRTFVALDVETTGLRPTRHRVIEVGAVRFENGVCVERFTTLVQPQLRLPRYIVRLTGIRDEDLLTAPPFGEVARLLLAFLSSDVIIGYNVRFDLDFLNLELRRFGFGPLANPSFDVLPLARLLAPDLGRYDLDAVCRAFGIERTVRHRALADAEATAWLYLELTQRARAQGIGSGQQVAVPERGRPVVVEAVARGRALLDPRFVENVPELPGVYLMRDQLGRVLYVGKARNLRQRLRSYFTQPLGYTRKMDGLLESVADIETIAVGSELEALLLECQFIQRYLPPYNTQLRNHSMYPYIKVEIGNPWPRVLLARRKEEDGAWYFGPFRSTAAARATVALLHEVLPLRTCHRSFRDARSYGRPCLQLALGRCIGPCTGKVSPEAYRSLIEIALRYLQGDTTVVVEEAQRLLAAAVERLDFERAARLRDLLRRGEELVVSYKLVQQLRSHGNWVIVTPCPETGDRAFLLVVNGRIWARILGAPDESNAELGERLASSWRRAQQALPWTLDQESVDAAIILARWLQRHQDHPAVIPLEEPIDWEAIICSGRGLCLDTLSVHGPFGEGGVRDVGSALPANGLLKGKERSIV